MSNSKIKVRIVENSFLARIAAWRLRSDHIALTLGRTIHLHKTTKEQLLADLDWTCHELIHVQQFVRYGFFTFLIRYFWETFRSGYYLNRFEVEARAGEKNRELLQCFCIS